MCSEGTDDVYMTEKGNKNVICSFIYFIYLGVVLSSSVETIIDRHITPITKASNMPGPCLQTQAAEPLYVRMCFYANKRLLMFEFCSLNNKRQAHFYFQIQKNHNII